MSDYINESLLGASPHKSQQAEAKKLVSKWEKTGLLDGLNQEFQKSGMAVMLENQAKQLISEATYTGGGARGASAGANSEEWSGVALPLVRRIFGEIAAQDFVSVQPMNLPSGLVFYLDFKYGKTTGQGVGFGTQSENSGVPGSDVTSLQGRTGPNSPSGSSAPYGVGGLYGAGRYDYSINHKVGTQTTSATSASATYKDINFNQEHSSSLGKLFTVSVPLSTLTNPDKKLLDLGY